MICGKIIYNSKQEASNTIAGFQNDKRVGKSKIKPSTIYFCNDCNGFHISSTHAKRKKRSLHFGETKELNIKDLPRKKFQSKHGTNKLIVHIGNALKIK